MLRCRLRFPYICYLAHSSAHLPGCDARPRNATKKQPSNATQKKNAKKRADSFKINKVSDQFPNTASKNIQKRIT